MPAENDSHHKRGGGELLLKMNELWCAALGLERLDNQQAFVELGGHSLSAVSLSLLIEEEFGVELTLDDIMKHPTVEQLSNVLERYLSR